MKTIYFYSPSPISQEILNTLPNESFSFSSNFSCWILRTYLHLKTVYHCELVTEVPAEGILLADRDSLGNVYPYFDHVMLICAKGDREFHPSANLHVVHNFYDYKTYQNSIWHPYYVSHWPQPGLISRDSNRGSKIENVAFIGTASQLAEELKSNQWIQALNDLDCKWLPIFNKDKWNDYRNIDVIIATRSFNGNPYYNKPASKLINCWWAGVPAILTPESSFMACRKSELDFLIIESIEDAINAIKKLKNNPNLYGEMVENGLKRAKEFAPEIVKQQWIDFFERFAFSYYDKWQSLSPFQKRINYLRRYLKLKSNRVLNRF